MSLSNNFKERFRAALGSVKAATEFLTNHDVTTAGTAEASKVVLLDASKGISTITSATITTLTSTTINATSLNIGAGAYRGVGLAYTNVADSTAVTSTATETTFDTLYSIPANTLAAGSVIRIRWCAIRTAVNATDTALFKSYLATNTTAGSQAGVTLTTSATTNGAANDIIEGDTVITIRTIGSSGTCVATSSVVKTEAASNTATRVSILLNSTTINTQTANAVSVSCTFNSTNAGNSAVMRVMAVEVII